MKKISKTILILLISVFVAGVFLVFPVNAQTDELVVEYWTGTNWQPLSGPIFNETNFLPGESVTRLIRVTNNSNSPKRIAIEAINVSDPDKLGDALILEIKEGINTLFNKTLSEFFTAGEIYLSNLSGNGNQTQYDFIITFSPEAQNSFQGKSLSFDLLIGFQGEEGILIPFWGTGGSLLPGLTIQEESVRVTELTETSVTITWTTSYRSTSQVIYAKEGERHTLDLTDNFGNPPKYGYERTTPEYDTPASTNGVTFHSVTITDLTPNTVYYYRTVSHGSLAISREYIFTTLGIMGEEKIEETPSEKPSSEETAYFPPEKEIRYVPIGKETEKTQEIKMETGKEKETVAQEEVEKMPLTGEEKRLKRTFSTETLLATIGAIPLNLRIILVLVLIVLLGFFIFWFIKKRRAKKFEK